MIQKHRISTDIGQEQKVVVELKQDYDLLEILSLKFTQEDVYRSLCSDYGVVCGRVSVNDGLGVPNARVSIFVPLQSEDENDPVISALYPYKSTNDKNDENYRYNLLPSRKQHGGHQPTGTFPDQSDILTREEVLEVYEKYYKYTVKTNNAGDFMIWGVPIGPQTLHIDVDLSDIGCFSLRPYDFIRQGLGVDSFKNTYEFKASTDLNSLPQIKSFDKTIEVFPFWGNTDLCEIGITRSDFDLSSVGVKVEPKAFLIGGTYTDINKNSVNRSCQPRRKMGRKCDLMTKTGKIEAIRFTTEKDENDLPILENFDLHEDIPEDGSFVLPVPMNMDYIYTNEFGENVITNDPNKGIPTSGCYRFRFSLDDTGNARVRKTASYLVPNIREYQKETIPGYFEIDDKSYAFSTDFNDYPTEAVSNDSEKGILYNINGEYYPRDYFFRLTYNKVFTISSFHNMYFDTPNFTNDRYIGIKELVPTEEEDCSENLTPPVNYGTRNSTFALIIADIVLLFEHIINLVIFTLSNSIVRLLFGLARAIQFWPLRSLSLELKRITYRLQEENQRELYLISYPECESCNVDTSGKEQEFGIIDNSGIVPNTSICGVGSINVSFTVQGQSTSSSPNYFTTVNCTPTPTLIPGATTYDKNTYFIQNQKKYYLLESATRQYVALDSQTYFILDSNNTNNLILVDETNQYFDTYNFVIVEFVDVNFLPTVQIEGGCQLYDTPYNEKLASYYYINYNGIIKKIRPYQFVEGMEIISTNLSNDDGISPYYLTTQETGSNKSGVIYFYKDIETYVDIYQLTNAFYGDVYVRKTIDGQSEFKNGVFTIVPGAQTNRRIYEILKEYRRRKRVAKLFCGGIVNYSFVDNWLSGSLYFFLFKAKKGKYCTDVVRYVSSEDKYYYRSTKYKDGIWGIETKINNINQTRLLNRPTTIVDLGPRDEFIKEICIDPNLDPNCSVSRSIGSTSFKSFGELLGLAINYRMDVSNGDFSIGGFFDNKGFNLPNQKIFSGDILQLISINNEAGVQEFDLQNPKYIGYSYQFLDPENSKGKTVFSQNGVYGPLPVTFYLEDDGERIRSCLNEPGRLTESSQIVPFFLWNKKGYGFGPYDNTKKDQQSWYYNQVQTQPLQGMTYAYKYNGVNDDSTDKFLLLPMTYNFSGLSLNTGNLTNEIDFDIIDTTGDNHLNYNNQYPGFTYLYVISSDTNSNPISGILYTRVGPANFSQTYQGINIVNGWYEKIWNYSDDFIIRPTLDYYNDTKQILSTPFLFYFGLKAGKTGLNKFIQFFGDKGAFTTAE